MEISVREYPVDPPADRAEFGNAALFDAHPAGEILVTVEQAGRPVQRVARVVDGWTLFGRLVGRTQEDPLLRRGHLNIRVQ